MKIGIFGGAFNPIHNGHLHLAECYFNHLALDKIIFIPTALPPHKTAEHLISGVDRINMLNLAIKDNSAYSISDIEFHRDCKSYTYDTICELRKIYPNDDFYLIIGSDQFLYFQNWYRAEEILNMVTVVTSAREENEYNDLCEFRRMHENMRSSIISNFDVVEVSSSQIRERIKENGDISDLVPKSVEKYIKDKNLYA